MAKLEKSIRKKSLIFLNITKAGIPDRMKQNIYSFFHTFYYVTIIIDQQDKIALRGQNWDNLYDKNSLNKFQIFYLHFCH